MSTKRSDSQAKFFTKSVRLILSLLFICGLAFGLSIWRSEHVWSFPFSWPLSETGNQLKVELQTPGLPTPELQTPRDDGRLSPEGTVTAFSNTTPIAIPASGTVGNASPYGSTINVSGITSTVTKVTVTLNQLTHSFARDMD